MFLLEGKGVTKKFGGLVAVRDVDFFVKKGEIAGLIGPNGAGKTTLFNCIAGFYPADAGTISFLGEDIVGLKPHQICRLGIARTFQLSRPFLGMTVLENTLVGVFGRKESVGLFEAREEAMQLMEFTGLSSEKDTQGKSLTLFQRKRLGLCRALAAKPELILLDEFAAGLNPTETLQSNKLLNEIRDDMNITIFWIEHVMKAIMEAAERIVVINYGVKIAEGTPKEIAENEQVIDAYLGERYA